jgi:hypothetical protein
MANANPEFRDAKRALHGIGDENGKACHPDCYRTALAPGCNWG